MDYDPKNISLTMVMIGVEFIQTLSKKKKKIVSAGLIVIENQHKEYI